MMKDTLIRTFANWLKEYSTINMMHLPEFAEYEIDRLLKQDATGVSLFDNENIFIGKYKHIFTLKAKHSTDSKSHEFCFEAIGIGNKENAIENDYELGDYTEFTYIVK